MNTANADAVISLPADGAHDGIREQSWRALWYFNWYRIIMAALFFGLALFGKLPPNFTEFDVRQFAGVAAVFFVAAVISQIALIARWGHYRYQVYAAVVVDIFVFTLIIHAANQQACAGNGYDQ